jgi:hypothetical protein
MNPFPAFAFTVIAIVLALGLTGLWRHRGEFFAGRIPH